jgi:choline dehydrogenase-like flavoprotein
MLNNTLMLIPRPPRSAATAIQHLYGRETTIRTPAVRSAIELRRSIVARRAPAGLGRHLANIVRGADDLLFFKTRSGPFFQPRYTIDDSGWFQEPHRDTRFRSFDAFQLCEQAPDPDNRITLTRARDTLGVPKPRVRFRWGELDRDSICRAQEIYRSELAAAGIGQLRYQRRDGYPLVRQISTHHPAGTTRMAAEARHGVVDATCRVHGTRNLYVASSSVFPTSGFATPTLTIMALAIRVADTVDQLLSSNQLPFL